MQGDIQSGSALRARFYLYRNKDVCNPGKSLSNYVGFAEKVKYIVYNVNNQQYVLIS